MIHSECIPAQDDFSESAAIDSNRSAGIYIGNNAYLVSDSDDNLDVHGILCKIEQDAIVGACSFHDRTGDDNINHGKIGIGYGSIQREEKRDIFLHDGMNSEPFEDCIVQSPVLGEMLFLLKKKTLN